MFEISIFEFVKNEFLTQTVNFGIVTVFSKGAGSAFSEGPGPGPLYKVNKQLHWNYQANVQKIGILHDSYSRYNYTLK